MGFVDDVIGLVKGTKNFKKGGPTLMDVDRGNYDMEKGQWKKGFEPAEEIDITNPSRPIKAGEVHKIGKSKAFTKGAGGE